MVAALVTRVAIAAAAVVAASVKAVASPSLPRSMRRSVYPSSLTSMRLASRWSSIELAGSAPCTPPCLNLRYSSAADRLSNLERLRGDRRLRLQEQRTKITRRIGLPYVLIMEHLQPAFGDGLCTFATQAPVPVNNASKQIIVGISRGASRPWRHGLLALVD